MYASGLWNGYWEQPGLRPAGDARFRAAICNGVVRGEGRDIVGEFRIDGAYDARGTVKFVKQYIGKHRVLYDGMHDGEGTIHGNWSIPPFWAGTFAIRPVRTQADPSLPIESIE